MYHNFRLQNKPQNLHPSYNGIKVYVNYSGKERYIFLLKCNDFHVWLISAWGKKPRLIINRFFSIIMGPNKQKIEGKIAIISLSIRLNICFGYSKEPSH